MNNYLIPIIISTIAGLSTILGSLVILFKIKKYNKFITFCLSFSSAVMLGISILDLIPESYFNIISNYGIIKTNLLLIIVFIICYYSIKYIDRLTNNTNDLYKLGILNMIVLILHNIPEGILTFVSSYHDISLGIKLSIAIMLHNIPEGISIAVPIYYSTNSFKKAFKAVLISGLSEPLGAILAFIFLKSYINELLISFILIIVACLMITLSIEEILPKSIKYKEHDMLLLGFITGIILVIINIFFF